MDSVKSETVSPEDPSMEESTVETPESTANSRSRSSTVYLVLLLVGIGAVAAFLWSRQQKRLEAAEAAAKPKIQQLGGLVLSGDSGNHVGSVNLALVRSQENFDQAIKLVSDLPWLKVLDLTGNSISGEQLKQVGQLKELTSLHMANTTIDDAKAENLTGLSSLTALHAPGTPLTGKSLESIGNLSALEVLDLSDTQITGDLKPLTQLGKLEWLVLKNVPLQDESLENLSKIASLKRLSLTSGQITAQQYKTLKEQRPGLSIDGMDPEEDEPH